MARVRVSVKVVEALMMRAITCRLLCAANASLGSSKRRVLMSGGWSTGAAAAVACGSCTYAMAAAHARHHFESFEQRSHIRVAAIRCGRGSLARWERQGMRCTVSHPERRCRVGCVGETRVLVRRRQLRGREGGLLMRYACSRARRRCGEAPP